MTAIYIPDRARLLELDRRNDELLERLRLLMAEYQAIEKECARLLKEVRKL